MYLLISRVISYNSDDASIVLEAQAMAHGNLLLRGWYMPTDNFLTIDIPFYALGLKLGFSPVSLLHIVPSLMYTLVILCSGYLVSTLLPQKQKLWGWLALLGIIAFPPLYMVQLIVIGPIHVGTMLFALLGLIAYRHFLRRGRGKWFAFAILVLLMILAIVGDPLVLVFLVVPLLLTEVIQMVMKKRISLQENAAFFGALFALGIAHIALWMLDMAGVYILDNISFRLTSISGMIENLHQIIQQVYFIFNADIFTPGTFSLFHWHILTNVLAVSIFGIAVIGGLIYAFIRKGKDTFSPEGTVADAKIMQVSLWSAIGTVASVIVSTMGGLIGTRYLYPLLVMSEAGTFPIIFKFANKHILRIAIVLLCVANMIPFAISLYSAPASVPPEIQLLEVLKEHHLTQGLGGYWVAAMATVRGEGQVVIRQVKPIDDLLRPHLFLADGQWFDPANLRQTNFIVYNQEAGDAGVYYHVAVRTFGNPDHQYSVGRYMILAWNTPLLDHIRPGKYFLGESRSA
jgi:hypothetical protein